MSNPESKFRGRPDPFSADELISATLSPLNWVIPDFLPEGLFILAGAPKIGKSWLMLDLAMSVSSGSLFLSKYQCANGWVLYLALEDSERRLQSRIGALSDQTSFPGLFFMLDVPRAYEGGIDWLDSQLKNRPDTTLVIIDTLARFRSSPKSSNNTYSEDYEIGAKLAALARRHKVAIIIVHHRRKMPDEDPLNEVSGSIGLTGSADGIYVLKRKNRIGPRATLTIIGRDLEGDELALDWNAEERRWSASDSNPASTITPQREEIIKLFEDYGLPMTPTTVATLLQKKPNNIKQLMYKMSQDGQLEQNGGGKYALPKKNNR